ncbi:MAG: hypothetical protein WC975_07335 [Phycisphaerae bacterium]
MGRFFENNVSSLGSSPYLYVIAAADSSDLAKSFAGEVLSGVDDQVRLQAIIDEVAASGGGRIFLHAGTYALSASIVLKDGVSIYGVRPKLIFTTTCPDLGWTQSGGTILRGSAGTETIFAANTDSKPETDAALSNVELVNLGFTHCATAINVGSQDHLGFGFGRLEGLNIVSTTGTALEIVNPQHLRMDNIKCCNTVGGLHILAFHRDCAPGNSVVTDFYVYMPSNATFGLKLEAKVSGGTTEGTMPLNFITMIRPQVNNFSDATAANIQMYGESAEYAITDSDAPTRTFKFSGDYSGRFNAGDVFTHRNSSSVVVDTCTIASISYVGGKTVIVTNEGITAHSAGDALRFGSSRNCPVQLCGLYDIDVEGTTCDYSIKLNRAESNKLFVACAHKNIQLVTSRFNFIESSFPTFAVDMDEGSNPCYAAGFLKGLTGSGGSMPLGAYVIRDDSEDTLQIMPSVDHTRRIDTTARLGKLHQFQFIPVVATYTDNHNVSYLDGAVQEYNIAANKTATLLTAVGYAGLEFTLTKVSATAAGSKDLTIAVQSGQYLNKVLNGTLVLNAQYQSVKLVSDGNQGWVAVWQNF